MRRAILIGGVTAGLVVAGLLGALAERWRIESRGEITFVDCDGHRQTITSDERFVLVVGDEGCMRLVQTPDRLSVTRTIDKRAR